MKTVVRAIMCITFILTSFAAWGLVTSLISGKFEDSSTGNRHTAKSKDDSNRTMELGDATNITKKDDGKEDKVLLNDPNIANRGGLDATMSTKAWEITQGSKDIIVAIIDTGVDANHKDITENLWTNVGETGKDKKGRDKATNGIDDDGNGYIDDVHGWNFVANNNVLTDTHGHGTHIAGIIGARGGNNFGISGVAPRVSLMVLKYYDPNTNNLKNTIRAMKYAVQMGAKIINYSGGGVEYSGEEFAAVKQAEQKGILFISAAGNEKSNTDESGKHYYPADYELSNIISVTAVKCITDDDSQDCEKPADKTKKMAMAPKILQSSNYGVRTVDIAAPGENIYSTLPGNSFGRMTGTSQATAFVTGVAALIMAHNREFSASDVKKYILQTGDEYPSLLAKIGTAKLLNSYKALTTLDMNVGATGVIASNTSAIPQKAFSSEQNLSDPKLAPSAFRAGLGGDEATEVFAGFTKALLKVIGDGAGIRAGNEPREPSEDRSGRDQ